MMTSLSRGLVRRRFDVDEVMRMAEAGVFADDERFELIDGELIVVPTPGPRHSGDVDRLAQLFWQRCRGRVHIRTQNPFLLDRYNLFLPDLALLRPDDDFYRGGHPRPEDALLVIEVADTSLWRDRKVKLPVYARLGVPRLWILELKRRCVHIHEDPVEGGYRVAKACAGDDVLRIPEGGEISAEELLG